MKSKKGFTLIELLAVIVILAVIALIATPLIMNVINDAKKNAAKDSAYGYVKAIENGMVTYMYEHTDTASFANGTITVASDGKSVSYTGTTGSNDATTAITVPVTASGSQATGGTLTVKNGVIATGTLDISGYTVTFGGTGKADGQISDIQAKG